jgi:uncharacterized protein (TIGR02145 family)
MKKHLLTILVACVTIQFATAQAPSQFKYQAVLRNGDGSIMASEAVSVDIQIVVSSPEGESVFYESHSVTTSPQGVINLTIGSVNTTGLAEIDWGADTYFIKVSVNGLEMGISQLLAVPYALHAKTADALTGELLETDPAFTAWDKSTGIEITESQISDLQTYLTEETDPAVTANFDFTDATEGDLLQFNGTQWVKVTPGYLTSYTETDPEFIAWDKSTGISVTENQISDLQNYLTTESDPTVTTNFDFTGAANGDLLQFNGTQWVKVTPGYLTSYTETDPEFIAWDKSTGISVTENQISDLQNYLTTESDPTVTTNFDFTGAANGDLLQFNGTQWVKVTPGYLTSYTETDPEFIAWDKSTGISITENQISDLQSYLTEESDPAVAENFDFSDAAEGDLLQFADGKWVKFTPNYLTSYTETDPAVTANFDFSEAAEGDLLQFADGKWVKFTPNYLTEYIEGDPAFNSSPAGGITDQDIINWDGKLDVEVDTMLWKKSSSDVYYDFGNVGIGTSSPLSKLSIEAGNGLPGMTIKKTEGNEDFLQVITSTGIKHFSVDYTGQLSFTVGASGPIYFGNFNNPTLGRAGFSTPMQVVMGIDAATKRFGIGGSGTYFVENAPAALLEVRGKANELQLAVQAGPGQTTNLTEWRNSSGTATTVVNSIGNIGIGTSNPGGVLDIAGGFIRVQSSDVVPTGNVNALEMGFFTSGGYAFLQGYNRGTGTFLPIEFSGSTVGFRANGTTAMKISTAGNVGIGTDSPTVKLHVTGNAKFGATSSINIWEWDGVEKVGINYNTSNGDFNMRNPVEGKRLLSTISTTGSWGIENTSGTELVRVNGAGLMGIGTMPESNSQLFIKGNKPIMIRLNQDDNVLYNQILFEETGAQRGSIVINGSQSAAGNRNIFSFVSDGRTALNNESGFAFYIYSTSSVNPGEVMRLTKAGNVGIGKTSPTTKLDVNGVITATDGNSTSWNTAYGWGNHSIAGYITEVTAGDGLQGGGSSGALSLAVDETVVKTSGNQIIDGNKTFTGTISASNNAITNIATPINDQDAATKAYVDALKIMILNLHAEIGVTDSRDGTHYNAVRIGNQVWMAENLKYLPSVVGYATGSNTDPYYYVYDYNDTVVDDAKATANYTTYGVLYNWPAAQDVCPTGWHVPSNEEWTILTDYVGGASIAGIKLKATSGWNGGGNGTDNYDFSALPGGYRNYTGPFGDIGYIGDFWSATQSSSTHAYNRVMNYSNNEVSTNNRGKEMGFSIRCLKDL